MKIAADQKNTAKPDLYFKLALGTLILLYTVIVGRAAVIKLDALGMGFDLGMYEQVIWNTAHGNLFATSAFSYTTNHLGSDPILLEAVLAPIYALIPATETLLVLQVIAIALGALPLYLLARDRLGSRWVALVIAAAYLAYVPLIHLALDEFQPRAFALVCVLFAVYYLDRKRFKPFVLFLALSLLTRSDVALWVALMGIVALLWRRPWRFVVTPIVIGACWFMLAIFVIVPHFKTTSGGFVYLTTYAWLGKTPTDMIVTALTRPLYVVENVLSPGKVLFLVQVFGPLAPFVLLRPDILLLAGPTLGINLLSPYSIQWTITHQYGAMLYPIAFASMVLGLDWLANWKWIKDRGFRMRFIQVGAVLVLGLILVENLSLGNPAVSFWRKPTEERKTTAEALIAGLPASAPLAVTNHVGPLAGRRTGFYFFPPHTFYTNNPLEVANYVLIDVKSDGGNADLKPSLQTIQTSADWKLLANRDGYLLYGKVDHLQ